MANFTDEEKLAAWNNAYAPPAEKDQKLYRLDSCGALIYLASYGKNTPQGWQVDHIFPESKGGKKDFVNLKAMQHQNNSSKSDSYYGYSCKLTLGDSGNNVTTGATDRTVHVLTRKKLAKLYGKKAE